MPDFRGGKRDDNGNLEESAVAAYRQRVKEAFEVKSTAAAASGQNQKRKAAPQLKEVYQANIHCGKALDWAIQKGFTENGLSAFEASGDRIGPLLPHQTRVLVPVTDLEHDDQLNLNGRTRRSVIVSKVDDHGTTEQRFEVPAHRFTEPMLIIDCDRGSSGWPFYVSLFVDQVGGLNGFACPSLAHRRNRAYKNAWHEAGVTSVSFDTTILYGIFRGPLKGYANYQNIWEGGNQYLRDDVDRTLFNFCYETLVRCRYDGQLPPSFGTQEHMEEMFERSKSLPKGNLLCSTMKASRWMEWSEKHRATHPVLGDLLMRCLQVGIYENFFDNIDDLPFRSPTVQRLLDALGGHHAATAADGHDDDHGDDAPQQPAPASGLASAASAPVVTGAAPPLRETVKGYNDDPSQKKKKSLKLALRILCSVMTRRISIGMEASLAPIEQEHRETISSMKSQWSVLNLLVDVYSQGKYLEYIVKVLGVLDNAEVMAKLEFILDARDLDEDSPEFVEDGTRFGGPC